MKKKICVPVGCEPKISIYRYTNEKFIDYGFSKVTFSPAGKLKSLIGELDYYLRKYRDRYHNMSFQEVRDCYCAGPCSCSPAYILYGERYETDLEYQFRVEKEAKQLADKKERDRRLYEELKDQFGED